MLLTMIPKFRNRTSMRCTKQHTKHKQAGATIVEILVAVLILSFGMLGMAALQTRALQGNQSSTQKSQAITLANYLVDVMRIDRAEAALGNYNLTDTCGANGISGTTLAQNNLRDWMNSATTGLGGTVCATVVCNANFVCTVRLRWDDREAGGLNNPSIQITSTI